jgi:hypothetical protein
MAEGLGRVLALGRVVAAKTLAVQAQRLARAAGKALWAVWAQGRGWAGLLALVQLQTAVH